MSVFSAPRRVCSAVLLCAVVLCASAYDPPAGAFFIPSLASPWGLASTPTVTGGDAPWASWLNPSVSAGSALTRIEAAYVGISDFGTGTQGWGSSASLAFSMPLPYGVWGAGIRFFSQSPGMTDMPLGSFGALRGSFAKAIFPNFYAGLALNLQLGDNGGFGWGLSADLGITHLLGDLGFLKDFRYGIAITDMGKGYSTPAPASGAFGSGGASSYPSAFTLGLGARASFIRSYDWNWDFAVDLRSPSFQDLDIGLIAGLSFRDIVSLRVGWSLGLRDILEGTNRSLWPTVGLMATIPLKNKDSAASADHRTEVGVAVAAAPLYGKLWALGAGVSYSFGLKDRRPPEIDATLPVLFRGTYFISPNGDGDKDSLNIPVKIRDEGYIAGWKFKIEDRSAGKVVRSIGAEHEPPEKLTSFASLWEGLAYSKKNVSVPSMLVWDGRDNAGNLVPDGPYLISIEAWDDSGNHNIEYSNCMVVVVDTVPPQAGLVAPGGPVTLVFSPDGDNNKDFVALRGSGSPEKLWTLQVDDAKGIPVRRLEFRDSAPGDFPWDGTDNAGKRVADGKYSARLFTRDDAGNQADSSVRDIIVDTRRPEVSLSLEEYAISPNGDGVKDTLTIHTAVESFDGLEAWKLSVMDASRKALWSAGGDGESPPESAYIFDGISHGDACPDGEYEASFELVYANGYSPVRTSDAFVLDSHPPVATLGFEDTGTLVFSPDGDASRDEFALTMTGSPEDLWMLELRNAKDDTVRLTEFTGADFPDGPPARWVWNGKDNEGRTVPDGQYSAFLWSVDRAGNLGTARTAAFSVDTRRPALRLAISRDAFSPNGDGQADSLDLVFSSESTDGLGDWKLWIEKAPSPPNAAAATAGAGALWLVSGRGAESFQNMWRFDGKASGGILPAGSALPDGTYVAKAALYYVNGYSPRATSPDFVIDTVFPSGSVEADRTAFNPAGKEAQSKLRFTQSGSAEELWLGSLRNEKGEVARQWNFGEVLPQFIVWDGNNESGALLPDGDYFYSIHSTDRGGNAFVSPPVSVLLDTQKKQASLGPAQAASGSDGQALGAEQLAFSPNGDGIKDSIRLSAAPVAPDRIQTWILRVRAAHENAAKENAADAEIFRTWKGQGPMPETFVWDGLDDAGSLSPDGHYIASLRASYSNGDEVSADSPAILLDTVAPKIDMAASPLIFSPNGDGRSDRVQITQSSVPGDDWTGLMRDAAGARVRSWTWKDRAETFVWDGTDQSGNLLANGIYSYTVSSTDSAGNSASCGPIELTLETGERTIALRVDTNAFSPNADGVKDQLSFSVEASAKERLASWELVISAVDAPGLALEGAALSGAALSGAALSGAALRRWSGVNDIQAHYIWDGRDDSGLALPEGNYAATLTARYLNDDFFQVYSPSIRLDRTFPAATASALPLVFSPNGDGRSDTVQITQSSVPGDDWTGLMHDASGATVRSWTWEDKVKNLVWDGRDQRGKLLPDSIYSYSLRSTDAAGNSTTLDSIALRLETGEHKVAMTTDTTAFSPNGDGVQDQLRIAIQASAPERIASWSLLVSPVTFGAATFGAATGAAAADSGAAASADPAAEGLVVRSWKGDTNLLPAYIWDGRTDSGAKVPDGSYIARLVVHYLNDDYFDIRSPVLLLDTIAPHIEVSLSPLIFSPNGDGRSDTLQITQSSVPGDDWTAVMQNASGTTVRSWTWNDKAASIVWNGTDESGNLLPNGVYSYTVRSTDSAGNSAVFGPVALSLETGERKASLGVDTTAFSPNGDGVKDQLRFSVEASAPLRLANWSLDIAPVNPANADNAANAATIRHFEGTNNLLPSYVWDGQSDAGTRAPDGVYAATLSLHYLNDDYFQVRSPAVRIDTVAPAASVSAQPLLFSPNDDGNKDVLNVTQSSAPGDDWTGRFLSSSGAAVRTLSWKQEAKSFVWDGKNDAGQNVRDGKYSYELSAVDAAGNKTLLTIPHITVDASIPKVYVTASDTGMSPNGDGIRDDVSFNLLLDRRDGIETWRFSLLDIQGNETSYFAGSGDEVPARIVWDGRDLQGQILQGEFVAALLVHYLKGDIAQARSQTVTLRVDPPKVSISLKPEYFSPDSDGVDDVLSFAISSDNPEAIVDWKLEIVETAVTEGGASGAAAERLFKAWSAKGAPPARIDWDGLSGRGELVESASDYPFRFTAHDALGNSTRVSGIITVDVLVIRDGDRLKIRVPSIVFRANYPDFVNLDAATVARNNRVVARIAQILDKFPDYRIRVEGHANNVGKMLGYSAARIQAEETNELMPLSTGRAELIRSMLVQNGTDARRLSVKGLGSAEPVVPFSDVENRWKNRRVEFILIKN